MTRVMLVPEEPPVNDDLGEDVSDPAVSKRSGVGCKTAWRLALGVTVLLVLCCCAAAVMLVLLGIIAEPETVIEQIVRWLFGR